MTRKRTSLISFMKSVCVYSIEAGSDMSKTTSMNILQKEEQMKHLKNPLNHSKNKIMRSLKMVFLKINAIVTAMTIPKMYSKKTMVPAMSGKKTPAINT